MGISVGIIEDNLTFSKNIEDFIVDLPVMELSFNRISIESILEYATFYDPDIILLDIELPGISGINGYHRDCHPRKQRGNLDRSLSFSA